MRPAMMSSLEVEVEQFGWEEIVDDLVMVGGTDVTKTVL